MPSLFRFLSVIAINQIVGQILFRVALARSGEIKEDVRAPASAAPAQEATPQS